MKLRKGDKIILKDGRVAIIDHISNSKATVFTVSMDGFSRVAIAIQDVESKLEEKEIL